MSVGYFAECYPVVRSFHLITSGIPMNHGERLVYGVTAVSSVEAVQGFLPRNFGEEVTSTVAHMV